MTKEEAKNKLLEIHVMWNRTDLSREEYKAVEKKWWELTKELYESKNHDLHMLGYFEFNVDSSFCYCSNCVRRDECPYRDELEENEYVTECNMHRYWDD